MQRVSGRLPSFPIAAILYRCVLNVVKIVSVEMWQRRQRTNVRSRRRNVCLPIPISIRWSLEVHHAPHFFDWHPSTPATQVLATRRSRLTAGDSRSGWHLGELGAHSTGSKRIGKIISTFHTPSMSSAATYNHAFHCGDMAHLYLGRHLDTVYGAPVLSLRTCGLVTEELEPTSKGGYNTS